MSSGQYIRESVQKCRRFQNGTVKLHLHVDGIHIHGTAEVEADPPVITTCDRIVHWTLLESAASNILEYDIGLVVDSLRLVPEADDASS